LQNPKKRYNSIESVPTMWIPIEARLILLTVWLLAAINPSLAQQLPSTPSQRIPTISSPTAVLDLKTQADLKFNVQIAFDPQGRLLVLYRDKKPTGQQNWHLLRITDALGNSPKKEEMSFDPLEAPKQSYSYVRMRLLLTDDGKIGYVLFTVETSTHGHTPIKFVANAVAVDLNSMKLLAKGELGENSYFSQVTERGDLLSADGVETQQEAYKVITYEPNLLEQTSVLQKGINGLQCWLRRDASFLCAEGGQLNRLDSSYTHYLSNVGPEWHIWHLPLLESKGLWGVAFKDVEGNRPHREDRLWKMTNSGLVSMSPYSLTPECNDRWNVNSVSDDGKVLLAVCFEEKEFMDAFFHDVLRGVQLIDATNLTVRRRLTGVHGDPEFAVWHGNGQTVIAVLENAERLNLYAIVD